MVYVIIEIDRKCQYKNNCNVYSHVIAPNAWHSVNIGIINYMCFKLKYKTILGQLLFHINLSSQKATNHEHNSSEIYFVDMVDASAQMYTNYFHEIFSSHLSARSLFCCCSR